MLGSISLRGDHWWFWERTVIRKGPWVLWQHQPLLGQGRCAEKMNKATAKRRHWIWGERNGDENWWWVMSFERKLQKGKASFVGWEHNRQTLVGNWEIPDTRRVSSLAFAARLKAEGRLAVISCDEGRGKKTSTRPLALHWCDCVHPRQVSSKSKWFPYPTCDRGKSEGFCMQ